MDLRSRTTAPIAALCLALAAAPALAREEPGVLAVADDGGLPTSQWRALRALTLGELRKREVPLAEDVHFERAGPIDEALVQAARRVGAKRIFALRIGGHLGQKVPLVLDELDTGTPPVNLHSAGLTCGTIDDCEAVIPRLVEAVLSGKSADDTISRRTVTANDARPYQKKAMEKFWFFGLPLGLYAPKPDGDSWIYGISAALQWETESFRLGPTALVSVKGGRWAAGVSGDIAWLPLDGQWTPFLGVGLGYFGGYDGGGFGVKGSAGVEAFRLYGIRLNVGVDVLFPFYNSDKANAYKVYPVAHVQFGF